MSDFDAVVIGGGVNGLAASLYLAKAKQRVLLVEAGATLGGLCQQVQFGDGFLDTHLAQALYALDPRLTKDFRIVRKALTYAARDLPLTGIAEGGHRLSISRDVHGTARALAALSATDAKNWPRFRKELFELARAMRKLWWVGKPFDPARLKRAHQAMLVALQTESAAAWLDSRFQSDLLKATLAFDANASSILEPGSALTLLWRAAQEMCGLQGAVAVPMRSPGVVTRLLGEAAAAVGVSVRTAARVERIVVKGERATGVVLDSGEVISGGVVLSSLSRRNTLLGLAADAVSFDEARRLTPVPSATGSARISIALSAAPDMPLDLLASRIVAAERLETLIAAEAAARAGELPSDLAFETIVSSHLDTTLAPPERHLISCLVRLLPVNPRAGWIALKPRLTAKLIAAIDRFATGIVPHVIAIEAVVPGEYGDEDEAQTPERILAPWRERVCTSIAGLYLCGAGAEPVAAVSGRAGRIAAQLALKEGAR